MKKIHVYNVDKDVPLPPKRQDVLGQYALRELEVGESILFPVADRTRVSVAASTLKKKTGKDFTIRIVDTDSARIWRVS